jgi:hypothetical protein
VSRPADLRPAAELAANKPHGTRAKYNGGCKCMLCRAANSAYSCMRDAERRAGRGAGIKSAHRARRHILLLAERFGVGYKSVARDARVGRSIVFEIRSGTRTRIRASTERKILMVDESAAKAGTAIPAAPTWKKIEWLLSEGFTKKSLCERLGYRTNNLALGRETILARNARRVDALYRKLRVGAW